jgi:hypothetical protein
MYKYRAVYLNGQLVTVLGVKLWWKWPVLWAGYTYGETRLFKHPFHARKIIQ